MSEGPEMTIIAAEKVSYFEHPVSQ
jgi:hypothetical protein